MTCSHRQQPPFQSERKSETKIRRSVILMFCVTITFKRTCSAFKFLKVQNWHYIHPNSFSVHLNYTSVGGSAKLYTKYTQWWNKVKSCEISLQVMVVTVTHFMALVSFLSPDNISFNGGIERDQWHKMGLPFSRQWTISIPTKNVRKTLISGSKELGHWHEKS